MATKSKGSSRRPARQSRSSSVRKSGRAKRYGCQTPRLFTPPLRELTPETSLGFEVIEFADWLRHRLEELDAQRTDDDETDYLAMLPRLLEWQRWLLIHALELLIGSTSVFRFRTVLLLVARQNGKSVLLTVLILWRMFQDGAKMTMETHASLDHAKAAWEEAVAIAEAIPELADEIAKKTEGKGSELLRLDGGEKFKIATANRRGGRGFRGDLVIFDELRDHQTWASWSATSKTTMARRRAQVWGVSNAGDSTSIVLRHLRKVAIASITGKAIEGIPEDLLGDIDIDSIGLFEWSAGTIDGTEDGQPVDIWDRDGWARANPSMGYTELDERAIANAALSDPEWEFRTEVLCQFVNMIGAGPFPTGSWAATLDTTAARKARGVKRDESRVATYGIDMSYDRTMIHVALAFWDTEGRIRVQIAAGRAGPDWVIPWLKSPKRKVAPTFVTMQGRGAPITSMIPDFEDAGFEVTPWGDQNLAGWHGTFYDLLRRAVGADDLPPEVVMTHGLQPAFDTAATGATIKAIGDGWVIDRRASEVDVSPLLAAIAAVGLLRTNPEPPAVSAYEENDLMVV